LYDDGHQEGPIEEIIDCYKFIFNFDRYYTIQLVRLQANSKKMSERWHWIMARIAYFVSRIAYLEALGTKSEALNKSKTQMTKKEYRISSPYKYVRGKQGISNDEVAKVN
jgi:hypothetical protein